MEALINKNIDDNLFSDLLLKKKSSFAGTPAVSMQMNQEALYYWSIVESWRS